MPSDQSASSKPKYPIPWIATYFITALVLIVGSFAVVWYVNQFSSDYDYTDPDMAFLERIVISPDPRRGDFADLNNGDWQALCLIGWQGDLAKAMALAKLPRASMEAMRAGYGAPAKDMELSELVIVYTDKTGAAKSLTHPHGFAFARQGAAACTLRAHPVLALPIRR